MRLHCCSVAFRHQPVTATGLAAFVTRHGFDGLEIWAPHAAALRDEWQALPARPRVPMMSGYLPLGTPGFDPNEARALLDLARDWRAPRLRLFAGTISASAAGAAERAAVLSDLARCADLAAARGLAIAIETHPGTLADSGVAAARLMEALDNPAVGLNLDLLHLWEAGDDPLAAVVALAPHALHLHLKSVASRADLDVFAPSNVHDPAGCREGMCPLFDGALDYAAILPSLPTHIDAALEWFGPNPEAVMAADLVRAQRTLRGRLICKSPADPSTLPQVRVRTPRENAAPPGKPV